MRPFFALFFLLFAFNAWSQKVLVSDELNLRNDLSYDILGELKGRVLLLRQRSDKIEIQAFDENMRSSWNKEIELEKRLPGIITSISSRDSFTVFYHHREKGNTVLRADHFDHSANKRRSTMVKNFGFTFFTPNFKYVRSEDRSKMLIYYIERHTFNIVIYDAHDHTLLWENSITVDEFNDGVDQLHMQVDNKGRMFMLMEQENFIGRRDKHRFDLVVGGAGIPNLGRASIAITDRVTLDTRFELDNMNQRIVGVGLYSERSGERAEGYFFVSIPFTDLLNTEMKFHDFDDAFVTDMEGKEGRQGKGLGDVTIRDIVLRRDGGLLILGEESTNTIRGGGMAQSQAFNAQTVRATVDYYFNDMFAISIHPNGEEHWKKVLYKKQYSQDDQGIYSSYFLFKTPQNVRLIFNDEIKFENTVSEYLVKGNGINERHSLLSTELLKLRLRFRDAIQISADRVIVPSERRGQLRVAKIIL